MINEPSSKKTISSKKLHLDQHKINKLSSRLSSKSRPLRISLNKFHLINDTNNDSFTNNIKYRNPYLQKFRHLNKTIFNNLTSRELKGFYNYDTLTNINNISDKSKNSYFEDFQIEENNYNKKIFLTSFREQRKLRLRNNNNNDLTRMKTEQSSEIEKINRSKKENNGKKSNVRIPKVKTLNTLNHINLESILLKKNIKSDKNINLNITKKLKRASIIDRLIFKITNPDDCFEDYIISDKPGDKYINFYKQIKKKQNQIYKILLDVMLEQKKNYLELKQYNAHIQRTEYILKTKYNNQHIQKYKSSIQG